MPIFIDPPDINQAVATIIAPIVSPANPTTPNPDSQKRQPTNEHNNMQQEGPLALIENVEFATGGPNWVEANALALPIEAVQEAGPNATISVVTLRTARSSNAPYPDRAYGQEIITIKKFTLAELVAIRGAVINGDPDSFLLPLVPNVMAGQSGNIGQLPVLPIETELGVDKDGLEVRMIINPGELSWVGPDGELVIRPIDPGASASVFSIKLSEAQIQSLVASGVNQGAE